MRSDVRKAKGSAAGRATASGRTGESTQNSNPTRRLKLTIAYDGAPFAGWQSQSHRNTIQDHLERAFERILSEPVRVHGAGRTDAGVHALAQCAHADVPYDRLSAGRWQEALNALLPPTIRVLRCQFTSDNFHARRSAKGKIYRYRIWLSPVLPPLEHGQVWHVRRSLDFKMLKQAAKVFVGTHDFAGFAANRGKQEKSTIRSIHSVRVRQNGPSVTIEFYGDGFLYKMVRLIVGSLVDCALGKVRKEDLAARLNSGKVGTARLAAPAEGLFLVRVRY
ncbi:MAG TPA: tRNA pseudouridine(38-40) synthase TruA [Candidatus Udaeobacter sp.]|nr:tRNA pseudouridine(38-40) synthase TruA [Candidatus Udaeobacter sp.]